MRTRLNPLNALSRIDPLQPRWTYRLLNLMECFLPYARASYRVGHGKVYWILGCPSSLQVYRGLYGVDIEHSGGGLG